MNDDRSELRQVKHRFQVSEYPDVVTGELFIQRAHNHYEANDGVPHSPEIDQPRLTTRQRVELLTQGGFDLHQVYRQAFAEDPDADDMDVVDEHDEDPNPPLTDSERQYLAAAQLRERVGQLEAEAATAAEAPAENAPAAAPAPASPSSVAPEAPRPAPQPPTPGS